MAESPKKSSSRRKTSTIETEAVEPDERRIAESEGTETSPGGDAHEPPFGKVRIHNNVFAAIARMAALKVPGVAELSGNFVDGLADIMGKKIRDRGIRVVVDDEGVDIEMHIAVEYGMRIPQVSWQLQRDVRSAIEQMTGKTVKALEIVVQGVNMTGPDEDAKEGGSDT